MAEDPQNRHRLAYAEGPEYTVPEDCFRDIYDSVLSQHGDRTALVSVAQHNGSCFAADPNLRVAQDCIKYTYQELHQHASSLATLLYAQGLRPQQTFATFLSNSAEFAISLLAAAILNVIFVPLDPRSLTRMDEVQHQLKTVEPTLLLVSDEKCAENLDRLDIAEVYKSCIRILIASISHTPLGWLRLRELFERRTEQNASLMVEPGFKAVDVDKDIALILFTSGTSSLPKACPLTCKNVACWVRTAEAVRPIKPEDCFLQQFPISHVAAIGHILQVWAAGARVVIPSNFFDASASLHAIERERCTLMPAVPSIIDQLITLPDFSPAKVQSLDSVVVGATIISPEFILKCKDSVGLGARAVIPLYELTEAFPVLTWDEREDLIIEHGFASVGKPLWGTKVKICPPGSRVPSMMGEVGELHISTSALIPGYSGIESDAFYHEAECRWFATGDQARMHASGAVFILGRYKDVIIRGGENLSPASIENRINTQFPSIQVQVVGISDEMAGEVPIAVVRAPDGLRPDATQIQKFVRESLGPASVPQMFLTLHDLKLECFPSTASGKAQKHELKKIVAWHFETQKPVHSQSKFLHYSDSSSHSTKAAMLEALDDTLGYYSQDASLQHQPLSRILDSLSLMKFASIIRIKHKLEVSMADMTLSNDLDDLVSRTKRNYEGGPKLDAGVSKDGPPERVDLIFEEESGRTRSRTEPILQRLGLNWQTDVQEVYPIAGTSIWSFMKEASFHHRWTLATSFTSYDQVRHAVEISLCQWPVLRSVAVEYSEELRLLVALRAHKRYFDLAISGLPDVESIEDLREVDAPTTHARGSFPEGLLFHVRIAKIEKTGTFTLLVATNHAAYDFISIQSWAKDLQRIISGHTDVARTPFKLFADAYYLYQDSLLAKQARDYHKWRFELTRVDREALWPAGDDLLAQNRVAPSTSAKKPDVSNNDHGMIVRLLPGRGAGTFQETLHCPNMTRTRFSQNLSPVIVAKMAISLFNCSMTGQSHAILAILMAGRIWPFMSRSIAEHLPSPYDIAGPTLASVADVIRVDPQEEVGQLYTRMKAEQKRLNLYQHIPCFMIPELNDVSQGVRMQAVRQIFNWIPGHHREEVTTSSGLHMVGDPGDGNSPPAGVVWMCKLVDSERLGVRLRWNSRLFSEKQAAGFVKKVLHIVELICEPDHWLQPIEESYSKVTVGDD